MSGAPLGNLLALELLRPWGLVLLALPLLFWLLSRRTPRPLERYTGTLGLWREVQGDVVAGPERRRARLPLVLWAVLAALVAGGLGVAGIASPEVEVERRWRVIVDRSPSMYLGQQDRDAGGASRLQRGLSVAQGMLGEACGAGDRVEWLSGGREPLLLAPQALPPEEWLAPPRSPSPEPSFERHDLAGTLWITDRVPDERPVAAGLVAVGGSAAPGAIGVEAGREILWDAAGALSVGEPVAPQKVSLVGAETESNPLAELFLLWARVRQLELRQEQPELADLELRFTAPSAGAQPCLADAGRWRLGGLGQALELDSSSEQTWLRGQIGDRGAEVLVASAPGRIRLAWSQLEEPSGSQAAFALSWSELFDQCLMPAAGVVSLAERQAPGAALSIAPRPTAGGEAAVGPGGRWSLWLASLAALLGLLALIWDQAAG